MTCSFLVDSMRRGYGAASRASFVPATLRVSRPSHNVAGVTFVTDTGHVEWPVLTGLPSDDVRELLSAARRRTFGKGEVVFHRDDLAESLHFVVRGRFAVRVSTPVGDNVLLDVLRPGDTFGELALLVPDERRSATVSALESGETRSLYRDDFARLQRSHPGVKDVLLRLLAEQLRRASERIVEAHYVDAETRVRRRVCELADAYGDGGDAPVVPLTQEDLAAMAGTSRATVNRVLREDEKRGSVRLERGRVVVLDADGLGRRCAWGPL
jgi:CRP-like cAMP-binding protein